MGQTLGRAPLPKGCERFVNLPRSCVYDLWDSFNDIAEGFGLSIEEFQDIIKSALLEHLGVTERVLNVDTDKVFRIFDNDENNLVDSLEFLSSFAMLSGMTPDEKIRFIFAMYDFDESSVLTLDEMVLAFRSTLSGLAKLSHIDPPTELEVENIVVQAFENIRKAKADSGNEDNFDGSEGIEKEPFLSFCLNTPEIISWIEFFDDLEEYQHELDNMRPVPLRAITHMDRAAEQEAAMSPTTGGFTRLAIEKKGLAKDLLPRQSWQNVIPFISPARLPDQIREAPFHNFNLDWIFGWNSHSSRQSIYYSAKGSLIYAAGAVCIVHNVQLAAQTHFKLHTDLVICIKVYFAEKGDTVVASGECGVTPAIHIWDCESKVLLSTLKGFHRNGIAQLDFSPDNRMLVSLGMDTYNSLAVYLWRSRERIWASRTTADKVYDVRFLADNQIGSCGKNHVYFWRKDQTKSFKRYRGLFGTATAPETLLCIAAVGNTIVTGSETGMLHIWEGRNWISSVRGHSGRVNAMFVVNQGDEKGLVTACTSGKVQVWNAKLEIGATFNANSLGAIEPTIVAITWDLLTSKILIGFKTCEIFEMDSTDGRNVHKGSVVAGHFSPRLTGLATHPLNPNYFCTVGKDKTVRVFDTLQHCQVKMALLDTMAHCCAYSPDGQVILIGYGSGIDGKEERKEGGFVALNEEDLTIIHEARDSKGMISDCKFSPDGKSFVLASFDGSLYIYQSSNFAAKAKCRGHSGKVNHFDFSNDSQFMMSNSTAGEVIFWDVERGEQQAPKLVKEVQWETNTCVYSYATQGIWSVHDDKLDCNVVARSNARDIILAGDNYGRIRVFNSPCVREDPNFVMLRGHSAVVENCRFSTDDGLLLTCGGTDGSVFQWRVSVPVVQDTEEMKKDESSLGEFVTEMRFEGKAIERSVQQQNMITDNPVAVCLMEEGVDVSTSMQPWQRAIVAPSTVPPEDNSEPSDMLELEHINGFNVDRSREALMYARGGEISFFSSNIAVMMDQKLRKQRFYTEHSSTITAMAVHPTERIIATGQQSETAAIRVWSSATLKTICALDGYHRRGICHLAFSSDGRMLATVGHDRFHSVAVYDWANQHIISCSVSFTAKSLCLKFYPNNAGFIQCGNETIRFWEMDGLNLKYQDALFSGRARLQRFMCSGWIGSNAVVGTADGNLYRFIGRQLDGMVQAHVGCINAISSSNDGICTAGQDGFVKVWSRILECRLLIDMKQFHAVNTHVRCIDWDADLGRIAIGTLNSEIFEISTSDGENLHGGCLMEGHAGDELWGLTAHPIKDLYATVGDDSILHVWDIFTHTAVSTVPLEMPSRCAAYSPDGRRIAIGFGSPKQNNAKQYDGKWVVLDTEDYQVTHEARDSTKWLIDMKFAPNGEFFAVGSSDNKIYVYSVLNGYALNAAIGQHNAMVLSVDFSADSAWLQSNCAGMELCFFEADTGMFIPAASRLRDVAWGSQNCSMGWGVQGIWPPQKDGTEITAVDCNLFRGVDGTVVASGDSFGRVHLHRYPCTSSFSMSKKYKASSNPITRIRFVAGDSSLITISGQDKTIMQWTHRRDRSADVAFNVLDRGGAIDEDDEDVLGFFCLSGKDDSLDLSEFQSIIGTRPWVAAMIAPTLIPKISTEKPKYRLEKNHLFGIQGQSTRLSVRFNGSGDVIYPVSRYVCVYNKKANAQIFYEGHESELSCIGVSIDGKFAASAERSNRPCIHVWDANTCDVITVLPNLHRRGVVSIQFSKDNKYMLSVGQDQDHSIALWESPSAEWDDGKLLAWNKGDHHPVLFCAFYHNDEFSFASGGRFHQKFWSVNGRSLNASYAEYSGKQKLGTLLSGAAINSHIFVSGSTTGNMFVWHGRKLDRVVRAHEMGVTGLWACSMGVVSVSKDGMIKLWSGVMDHIRSFSLTDADVPPLMSCIRSVDGAFSDDGSAITRVLVSTMSSEIYEISAKSGTICLMQESHYEGEVWGLGVHPTDPDIFATAGDDKTIRIWSISHKRIIRKAVLDSTARCINFSPDGRLLIVGLGGSWDGKRQRKDGAFIILDAKTLKPQFEGRDSRHWLQEAKFSPDGKLFAVGSMDHKIYIYNRGSYRLKGMCDRHNSYIKNFDFSEDSAYIQSDSGDYEHLYFEAEDGQYFASGSQLKDIRWGDWTCTFGWPVQGCWPYFDDVNSGAESEPTSIHRSPNKELIGVGDYNGNVKVFSYPCTEKDAKRVQQRGHVKEVSQVRFNCDNRYIISVGKKDRAIITWKVMPEL